MKREKILIVEDEIDLLNLIDFNLTRKGYRTEAALDGLDAVKKAEELRPDLIVLDLMLPEMDGWMLCRWLKNHAEKEIRNIPVLMLTAKAMPEDRMAGFEVGADDYITKPFNMAEFLLRIERLLKRKSVTASSQCRNNRQYAQCKTSADKTTKGGNENGMYIS